MALPGLLGEGLQGLLCREQGTGGPPSAPLCCFAAVSTAALSQLSSYMTFPFTFSLYLVQMQLLAEAGITGAMASGRTVLGCLCGGKPYSLGPVGSAQGAPFPTPLTPLLPVRPSLLCI